LASRALFIEYSRLEFDRTSMKKYTVFRSLY
jgi:hypothetical protein